MLTPLNQIFPNLTRTGYRRTSPVTTEYNCIAWALKDTTQWWEPDAAGFMYWPDHVRRIQSLSGYIQLFGAYGFAQCENGGLEDGFEKIAIYTKADRFSHVARQLDDGRWTSKLGKLDDITHELMGLVGDAYGSPTVYMKRRRVAGTERV